MSGISRDWFVPKKNKHGVENASKKIADRQKDGKFISVTAKKERHTASQHSKSVIMESWPRRKSS